MMTVNHMTEFVESIWKKQQKAGLETFDYENVLWGNEFPILLKSLKNLGIKEFTLSNKQGNMASILAELVDIRVRAVTERDAHRDRTHVELVLRNHGICF